MAPTAKPSLHATPSPTSAANGRLSSCPGSAPGAVARTEGARPVSVGPRTKGGSPALGAHRWGASAFGDSDFDPSDFGMAETASFGTANSSSGVGGGAGFLHAPSARPIARGS